MAFKIGGDGILRYQERLCVPNVDRLRGRTLVEAHKSWYTVYLNSTKMYNNLKEMYW